MYKAYPAVPLVARIFLAALFIFAGIGKVGNVAGTTGYFGKLGLPGGEALVWAVIAVEIVGGLLILVGFQTRLVAWIMAVFTIATAAVGHAFWGLEGAQMNAQLTQFLKNLSVAGGFLMLAWAGPGRYSLDKE
jgi:putative oxidoreductase